MDIMALTDRDITPTEEVIFSYLEDSGRLWEDLFGKIRSDYPSIQEEWKYYNDGKCWLMKATTKSKTIFWLSVYEGYFKTTFYFTQKAEEAISNSSISEELKKQFTQARQMNRIRGVMVDIRTQDGIADVLSLIELKLRIK